MAAYFICSPISMTDEGRSKSEEYAFELIILKREHNRNRRETAGSRPSQTP